MFNRQSTPTMPTDNFFVWWWSRSLVLISWSPLCCLSGGRQDPPQVSLQPSNKLLLVRNQSSGQDPGLEQQRIQSCKVSRVWPTLRREMLLSVLWSVWRWRPSSLTRYWELFERLRFYSPVDLPHTHCSYWLSPHWTSPRYRTQSPYLSFWIVSSLYSLFMFRVEFPVKSRSK